jgi:hypothetical protein
MSMGVVAHGRTDLHLSLHPALPMRRSRKVRLVESGGCARTQRYDYGACSLDGALYRGARGRPVYVDRFPQARPGRSRMVEQRVMAWWWMSFADPEMPKGRQFLGGLLIEADDEHEMLLRSHALGLNPGGEISFFRVPPQFEERVTPDLTYRLLSREECERIDRIYCQ